jgi:phospholipase C
MSFKHVASNALHCLRIGVTTLALFQFTIGGPLASSIQAAQDAQDGNTVSPIKHVIVIIGENRSFDHVFATYKPKNGQTVNNLLSEGIVNADGTPGKNFATSQQLAADDSAKDAFSLSPEPKVSFPHGHLPAPLVGGPKTNFVPTTADAVASENGLPDNYYPLLTTGGTGLTSRTPDTRITNVNDLPAGPFQLTNSTTFNYDDYAASPVHRFYQMWQQLDCEASRSTKQNPSGCSAKQFPWVETTVGAGFTGSGTNGVAQPANFSTEFSPNAITTGEGSTAMGFYNVQQGDAPYFKFLADNFSMSDNFHQSVQGGTGANHIMLGHGDMIWFSDGKGHAQKPPHNVLVDPGTVNGGVVDEIENPNPAPGTNNWYTEDGYGGGSFGSSSFGGGSYSECSDPTQPGVSTVVKYLQSLPKPVDPHCEVGHYYLLNNYNPGFFGNGNNAFIDTNPANTVFTIPPSSVRSIGDTLLDAKISWKYYGDDWNNYVADPYQINFGAVGTNNPLGQPITAADEYCSICNPFQFDTSIMADPNIRGAHIQDTENLYNDIANTTLPAVSFVKPSGLVDGHPASSKLDLFEGFTKKIVDAVRANPTYWKDTAIFITFDEGGGYYDSGFVQPLDFFGDGTRIPMIVVSQYSTGGRITHNYSDHVSILKFIERNWKLRPVTGRSRDNFPNPIAESDNPYVPINGPAISDLFELFSFNK